MSKTREFKVGDRVVADCKGGCAHGKTGTIVCLRGNDCGVELDGKFDGHDLNGRIKSKRGWWIDKDNLKSITKFKVGDRVRVRKDLVEYNFNYRMENNLCDGYIAIGSMLDFRGKTVTISEVRSDFYRIKENGLKWTDEMFEGLASECEEPSKGKIVIYVEGRDVIAKNTETGETAKATCHPDDEFDFNIGAKLAFERLMNPTKIVKQDKYAVGDRVKFRSDLVFGKRYGKIDWLATMDRTMKGKEVTVCYISNDGFIKVKEDGICFYYDPTMFEGKVVTVEKAEIKEVTEEKRKAERGEYIKITNASFAFNYGNGDIIKVTGDFSSTSVLGINVRTNKKTCCIIHDEYVVLNGYKPEAETPKKEEPKLYNGKVVCVASDIVSVTVGKIYEFVDGVATSDRGIRFTDKPIKSLDELHKKLPSIKVIEVVE